jgi:pilus assembly protein CpaC
MRNTKNNQNLEMSSAIVPVNRTIRTRRPRSAKAMAILAGGVLAVAAAVRVTTAHEAVELDSPATQPTADAANSADAVNTVDAATLTENTKTETANTETANTETANTPTTAPSAAAGSDAAPAVSGSHVMDVQYAAAETQSPTTGPSDGASAGLVSDGTDKQGRITIDVNKSAVITTRFPYTRISIGQPEIADANAIASGTVLITGKKAGSTQLILWDAAERSQVIDIDVVFDVRALQDELNSMFPSTKIQVKSLNGAIALSGHVPNAQIADQAIQLATPYSAKVLNFMEISGGQQVQLQVKIAEVDRTASSELGVNLGFTDGVGFGGTNIGPAPFTTSAGTGGLLGEILSPGGVGAAGEGGATQFGHVGIGNTAVDVFVDALRQNNLARMLAEPNLIAISGQNASFLAGGSFPYPVAQASGGGTTTTIEFQNYGVTLNFVPVVLGNGRIRLKVAPQVSQLDFAHEVESAGTAVPGLTIRQVETTVEMNEGQTFAIAGLLQNNQTGSKSVTPLLGDLPVIGPLFRSVKYTRNETELVVLVTPHLVEAMNPDQVPTAPGEHWRDPSENDLFINRDIGGEVDVHGATTRPCADGRPAARFHGNYGFAPATNQAAGKTDDAQASTSASTD